MGNDNLVFVARALSTSFTPPPTTVLIVALLCLVGARDHDGDWVGVNTGCLVGILVGNMVGSGPSMT